MKLQIQQIPVKTLKPSIYNPRFWDQKPIRDLTKSIKENGSLIPILVNLRKRGNYLLYGAASFQATEGVPKNKFSPANRRGSIEILIAGDVALLQVGAQAPPSVLAKFTLFA